MSSWKEVYERWRKFENLDSKLKNDLEQLATDEQELEDAFYKELTFGTGGMRGIIGPGTNRMNIYTIRKAVNGLAHYLLKTGVNVKDRGVVVAYDSRYMSQDFAIETAKVLGVHGIKTYVFRTLKPTPLLSFAVRHLGTVAGIMITASHNPPQYNGFKVYNEDGGQITLDDANQIIETIQQMEDGLVTPVADQDKLEEDELLIWIDHEVDEAYLQELLTISKMDEATINEEKDLKIVFTPLHGTAYKLVMDGLKQLQFTNVAVVEEQVNPDPEFSTVELPNPEEDQAFALAIEKGKELEADILLATDPDADRLGVAVRDHTGEYQLLTGNQLGSLMLDYILAHTDPVILNNARMIKTIVTSELGQAIASSYGVSTVNTLTGFKFIGEKIRQYDATGETFVFGYEESYGYLIGSFARDKDAVQATMMACEMAYYWKNKGKTLIDALHHLFEKHGYYLEGLTSLTLAGIEGTEKIKMIMDHMRHSSILEIAGFQVEAIEDYLTREKVYVTDGKSPEKIELPQENVIKFLIEQDSWVCLRPSGTEPKIKCYYGVRGSSYEESQERLRLLQTTMEKLMDDIIHS